METAEALDLLRGLPPGSEYVSGERPALSWTPEREAIADLQDTVLAAAAGLAGSADAPHVTRPRDLAARREASRKARSVRERIENGRWKEAV